MLAVVTSWQGPIALYLNTSQFKNVVVSDQHIQKTTVLSLTQSLLGCTFFLRHESHAFGFRPLIDSDIAH